MYSVIKDDCIRDGRYKCVKRRKLITMMYMHVAHEVCTLFLYGMDHMRSVKEHYLANGLETR